MASNPQTKSSKKSTAGPSVASLIPFDQISEPGAYVCVWNGQLLRVMPGGICPDRGPKFNLVGPEPLFVVKIDDNPFVTISRARVLASNGDVVVSF